MSVREAVVVRIRGREALVKLGAEAGCGRCDSPGGCRSGLLSELFGKRCSTYRVPALVGLQVGSIVQVRLPEHGVLIAALCVYGMPLAGLLTSTVLADYLAASDVVVVLAAVAGLVVGFVLGLLISLRYKTKLVLAVEIVESRAIGSQQ